MHIVLPSLLLRQITRDCCGFDPGHRSLFRAVHSTPAGGLYSLVDAFLHLPSKHRRFLAVCRRRAHWQLRILPCLLRGGTGSPGERRKFTRMSHHTEGLRECMHAQMVEQITGAHTASLAMFVLETLGGLQLHDVGCTHGYNT